ncbi:hypothetical protein PQO01_19535 [Lentisphaera marina]|uniref:hypothetical protein n=1 Tax=Lentisphaera marina TaxID=1111041 RepID=UPI002365C579|nr:hypothetical protein [Lentisphaera marina]MDD7987149.1 hypothetical protein [Lentisphaera marina]
MTMALCFNCGDTKFGALCPCPKCSAGPTEDMGLDILFSDHNFSVSTLNEFGNVIKAISSVSDNDELRFYSFMLYLSNNHNELLQVNYEDEQNALCSSILEKANVPLVKIEQSQQAKLKQEHDLPPATDEEMAALRSMMSELKNNQQPTKSWWQFWK